MSSLAPGQFRFHVSIDYGTYASGFSFTTKADGDASPRTFEPAAKTRTALLYRASSLAAPQAWGWPALSQYADLPEEERCGFVLVESPKRYLLPDSCEGLPVLPAGLTPQKLAADFLRCMVDELVLPTLREHYGVRFSPSLVRWCLTVPAGLSQSSLATMRKAAMDAGITPSFDSPTLLLATEPEAAALTAQQHRHLLGLSEGSRLLVLDLGGGTVDMMLHSVDSLLGGGDVRLSEVTHRECLTEGAMRVDERFQAHLAALLGHDTCAEWVKDPANAPDLQELLYDEWETCKRAFDDTTGATAVNLPASLVYAAPDHVAQALEAAGSSDSLTLSYDTMASFCEPSLDAVASKAADMLSRAGGADVVLLVGGFGSNRFVASYLRRRLARPGMEVVTPDYAPTAVLEGGVWFSRYPGAIAARRSCMAYGIRCAVPWRHGAPDRTWIEHRQAFRCLYGFKRYVKLDECVRTGSTVSHTFSPLYPRQRGVTFDVFGCLKNDACYTTEPTMVKIASVTVDFPPEPCGGNPADYALTAHFSFGEAQIAVRCVDEQTRRQVATSVMFDSAELLDRAELSGVVA